MKLNDNYDNLEAFEAEIEKRGFIDKWHEFSQEGTNGFTYNRLAIWTKVFLKLGLSFDYYLNAEPYDFELI